MITNELETLAGFELIDKCVGFIKTKYNTYFTNKGLVCEIIAEAFNVSVSYVTHCKKQLHDPYFAEKRRMRARVRGVLIGLEREGKIEKYSQLAWKKVKI